MKQLTAASSAHNVLGYMLSDLGDAGILYLLVTKHDLAFLLLKDRYKNRAAEKEILLVSVLHRPGELLKLLETLGQNQINVRTSYQGISDSGQAMIVIEPNNQDDLTRAGTILSNAGAAILTAQP
jgi:hypothetical protein